MRARKHFLLCLLGWLTFYRCRLSVVSDFFLYKIMFFVTKISLTSSFHLSRIDIRYISYFQSSTLVLRVRKR